ncbi:MAG: site-specific integrase, partial [Chloroflexota bacterium]|nr:site-specific integrase [Chloroflexota bacterium]
LAAVGGAPALGAEARAALPAIARVLAELGVLPAVPAGAGERDPSPAGPTEGILAGWLAWCRRWRDTNALTPRSRRDHYYKLLIAGRWIARQHPALADPTAWDYAAAAEYVAAVDRATVGQWSHPSASAQRAARAGEALAARTKDAYLKALRTFFHDAQAWGWLARRFDPQRAFRTPPAVRAQIGPAPRVIADDVWGKLLWAGLNLTAEDLAPPPERPWTFVAYPPAMVQALAVAWLFAGLRADELRRLPVGCVRWQRGDAAIPGTSETLPGDAVCWLDVPANKTGPPFTKPVDRAVGEAIAAWERARPAQPPLIDRKTGRATHYLFANRGKRLGATYLNTSLIPTLCRKANIPRADARGPITSHRARSTIASQLFNGPEPLTLFELKEWLGHKHLASTQHYARVAPTRLAKSLADADYFGRALRMVEVVIDKGAVTSGAAANGEPWLYYDLGHGYCSHPYFSQCPHRLVCAKCAFYRPKAEMAACFAQATGQLRRLREEVPLTEEERAVVEEDLAGYAHLLAQLADVPALDGRTPNQLREQRGEAGPGGPARCG